MNFIDCFLPWNLIFPKLGGEACQTLSQIQLSPFELSTSSYLLSFLMTFAIELSVVLLMLKTLNKKAVASCLVANLTTHPLTVLWWLPFSSQTLFLSIQQSIVGAEAVIPFVEAGVYFFFLRKRTGFTIGKALIISILANAASWVLVAVIQLYWPNIF